LTKQFWVALGLTLSVGGALHLEWWRLRRALAIIPIRVHVNGTRGKSSVTRLIASILREQGIPTVAKTTGTAARLILPDGTEEPIHRDGPANIGEMVRSMRRAAALGARAVVFECMAVDPDLQGLAERRIVQPILTVITNARLDHTDVQGTTATEIASAFAFRPGSTVVTADPLVAAALGPRIEALGGSLRMARPDEASADIAAGMRYLEHPENVAIAMEAARALGIRPDIAARGIRRTNPDPGAACVIDLEGENGPWSLIDLFAANDPESTFRALDVITPLFGRTIRPVVLFASRSDRTARSAEFASALVRDRERFSVVVVWGERTRAVVRALNKRGLPAGRLVDAGSISPSALTAMVDRLMIGDRVLLGVGNIVGPAQAWLEYLSVQSVRATRSPAPRELEKAPA
jgi:poly-gamma-glutamate synthase PgsB/CapB